MPQQKIDTHGLRIENLKEAAGKIRKIVNSKGRYAAFYSWITGVVHILEPFEDIDPDWILIIEETPYIYSQQEIADRVADKMRTLTLNKTVEKTPVTGV